MFSNIRSALAGTACAAALLTTASAADFNIPGGDLETALNSYSKQAGIRLMYPMTRSKASARAASAARYRPMMHWRVC